MQIIIAFGGFGIIRISHALHRISTALWRQRVYECKLFLLLFFVCRTEIVCKMVRCRRGSRNRRAPAGHSDHSTCTSFFFRLNFYFTFNASIKSFSLCLSMPLLLHWKTHRYISVTGFSPYKPVQKYHPRQNFLDYENENKTWQKQKKNEI